MPDKNFARDDEKATRNWRDHGVTFEMVREAFEDPFAAGCTDVGQDPSEGRCALIGMLRDEGRTLMAIKAGMAERGFKMSHQGGMMIGSDEQPRHHPGAGNATAGGGCGQPAIIFTSGIRACRVG